MDSNVKTEKFPTSFPATGAWSQYKNGSYNDVFVCVSDGHTWALKKAKISEDPLNNQMSDPERFERKNALINPGFPCQISPGYTVFIGRPVSNTDILPLQLYIHKISADQIGATFRNEDNHITTMLLNTFLTPESHEYLKIKVNHLIPMTVEEKHKILERLELNRSCVIMPFIGANYPSDEEIAAKVLSIYRATRNIIADACIPGNMLSFDDETICVDLDHALQRDSEISQEYWADPARNADYEDFWDKNIILDLNPKSVVMARTLFYLERHLTAEQITDDCLTPELIQQYNKLREQKIPITSEHIKALCAIITHHPQRLAHEAVISVALLDAVQLDSPDLAGHIHALFTQADLPSRLSSQPLVVAPISLFQFSAAATEDSDDELTKIIRTI